MKKRYILANWPEYQLFMEHPRWCECIPCFTIEGHPDVEDAWMIPEDLYYKLIV